MKIYLYAVLWPIHKIDKKQRKVFDSPVEYIVK